MAGRPPVSSNKIEIGRKGGGRHWTEKEAVARKEAASRFEREGDCTPVPPRELSAEAQKNWDRIISEMAEWKVFDKVDADLIAVYCETLVRYEDAQRLASKGLLIKAHGGMFVKNPAIPILESSAKILTVLADKLGLSPSGRARLAVKIAKEQEDENGDVFD